MARPKKYASAAERTAAYRARNTVIEVRLKPETIETLDRLCVSMDMPRNEVVHQLLQFALANREWHTSPLFTRRLPRQENPLQEID